jgi:hypothetical protein
MSTDTFETPRYYRHDTDDTPPTLRRPIEPPDEPSGPTIAERLQRASAVACEALDRAIDAGRRGWGRLRNRLRETATGLPRPRVARPGISRPNVAIARPAISLDASIVIVWSLAVALVAIEVALVVSPLLGIAIALLEGVALGASGRRLYRLVSRA